MSAVVVWAGVSICALVIGGCICRIDQLKHGRHMGGWILLYMLWPTFALGVLIDLLLGRAVDWWACMGVAGILLQLHLTRADWKRGPPADLERSVT